MISVLSSSPIRSSASRMRPKWWSACERKPAKISIMRAYRRRSSRRQRVPLLDVGVARGELGLAGEEPELLLAREHGLAVRVPAVVEGALVAVGPFLRHVMRGVRAAGRVVHEERLLRSVHVGVEHELDRLVGQVLAQVVALLGRARLGHRRVVLGQVRIPLVGLAAQEAVEALEAAAQRPAVERPRGRVLLRGREVPLAEAEGVVALLEQHLRQHPVLERHPAVVAGVAGGQLHDAGHAARVVVAAGQHAGARGGAERGGVHVRVAQPGVGHAVDVGRLDQAAERAELPVAHVVEHEEQDVRGTLARSQRGGPGRARIPRTVRPTLPGKGVPGSYSTICGSLSATR